MRVIPHRGHGGSGRVGDAGSASIELILGFLVIFGFSAAASDIALGVRSQISLDSAVLDAARMLSRAPVTEAGDFTEPAIRHVGDIYALALARHGVNTADAGDVAPGEADCTADGSLCWRISEIEGAPDALGRTRRVVDVWGRAWAPAAFMSFLRPEDAGRVYLLSAWRNQVHDQ